MNKKKMIAIVAVLVVVLACAGGGKLWLDHAAAAEQLPDGQQAGQETPPVETPSGAAPSFPVPTPIPSGAINPANGAAQSGDGAPTVTEDEDGNVTIVPNWEAKAQYAHPVDRAPEANMGGAGGGEMDMTDGVYLGDHPSEETPAPTPRPNVVPTPAPPPTAAPSATPAPTTQPSGGDQAPAEPTPAPTPAPTVAPSNPSGGPPSDDGTHKDGDISPDGKYGWFNGFGWVERGEGSYSTPSKGINSELSGEKVGEM